MRLFRRTMIALSAAAPPVAAEIAYGLWGSLGTPAPVHERDRLVHEAAITGELDVGGERIVTYRWGSGPHVVLLVHGWRSRASRFSALVTQLIAEDRTIVAFDAPGNGNSGGTRVTVLEYAETIRQLGRQFGGFDTIIGHSFGVLSSFLAVREGVATRGMVGIAGMYDADYLVESFASGVGIRGRAARGFRRKIERRTFPAESRPWNRFVAEVDPTHTHLPIFLIHDADDPVVDPRQLGLIADAHTGRVQTLVTHGLGHSKILGDPEVLAAVERFVSETGTRTRSSTS